MAHADLRDRPAKLSSPAKHLRVHEKAGRLWKQVRKSLLSKDFERAIDIRDAGAEEESR